MNNLTVEFSEKEMVEALLIAAAKQFHLSGSWTGEVTVNAVKKTTSLKITKSENEEEQS